MQLIQVFGEPFMLHLPIRLIFRVNIPVVVRHPSVASFRRLVAPFERKSQFTLDFVLTLLKTIKPFTRLFAGNV